MFTPELFGVLIGGILAISGSIAAILTTKFLEERVHKRSINNVVKAEIIATKEKAERFINRQSNTTELKGSTPLWVSIASEIGYLSDKQITAARRTITLDMEMRQSCRKEKAKQCVDACKRALKFFK